MAGWSDSLYITIRNAIDVTNGTTRTSMHRFRVFNFDLLVGWLILAGYSWLVPGILACLLAGLLHQLFILHKIFHLAFKC